MVGEITLSPLAAAIWEDTSLDVACEKYNGIYLLWGHIGKMRSSDGSSYSRRLTLEIVIIRPSSGNAGL